MITNPLIGAILGASVFGLSVLILSIIASALYLIVI